MDADFPTGNSATKIKVRNSGSLGESCEKMTDVSKKPSKSKATVLLELFTFTNNDIFCVIIAETLGFIQFNDNLLLQVTTF